MIGGTIICTFTPLYYIIDQKIIQNNQVVKKKLNLKFKNFYWLRPFWFKIQGQNFSQRCCFRKVTVENNIKKTFPEKSNAKPFKEF